jgi:hypothetical protein
MSLGINGVDISQEVVNNITTNTTLTLSYRIVTCDASGGAFTVTLPAAAGAKLHTYNIKKTDSSGNAVTIDGNASETVDGDLTKSLNLQYESLTIISNGSNWYII